MLFPTKIRVGAAGLVIAGGAAATLALGPAGPAVGQTSAPIQVQIQMSPSATLVAKGAAVDVSVTASCTGEVFQPGGNILVEITQSVAKKIAYGYQEAAVACTGTSQTFELEVTAGSQGPAGLPQGPSKAFAKGKALATASIQACSVFTGACTTQAVQPTITISK